jgi:putative transposase
MPNHYHFVVYQKNNKGINTFIGNFQNSFAKYFNILTVRTGSLFQDRFKAKRITSEPELKHVIRYIHLNPVTAGLIKLEQLETTAITSHIAYIQKYKIPFIKKDILKQYFSSIDSYKKFIADNEDYQKKLHKIKKLLFD